MTPSFCGPNREVKGASGGVWGLGGKIILLLIKYDTSEFVYNREIGSQTQKINL